MRKGDILMNLSTKILIGLGLGIIAGLELGAEGVDFAKTWIGPFGTIFMNMIKMIIVPLVFSSLVIGVCSLGISKDRPYRRQNYSLLFGNYGICDCTWYIFRYGFRTGRRREYAW